MAARNQPKPRRGRDGAAARAAAGEDLPISRILYLPADLVDVLPIYRAAHCLTNTQILLRALNIHHTDIDRLATHEQAARHTATPGDLFAEVTTTGTAPRRQVEVTPTTTQLAVIDNLVDTTTAHDRSHLAALAIRALVIEGESAQPGTSDSSPTLNH